MRCVWVEEKFVIVANVAKEQKLFFPYQGPKRDMFRNGGSKTLPIEQKKFFRGTPPLTIQLAQTMDKYKMFLFVFFG